MVIELKSKQSAQEIVELKQVIAQLQLENCSFTSKIQLMQQQRMNSRELFQANDMHESYLSIMKERERIIEQLHQHIKKLGD